ncbi:MipA/OmpV family protein [Paraburkholderia sp. J12]|uniref:MipA/OmpV family protein n=1 Tax=Paraburkholderia sp. J12 TaxID=2805432 RepID=UPI002ABE2E6E|nr:MipA/OmpV family protein [Paraburkholderia sp. J12]
MSDYRSELELPSVRARYCKAFSAVLVACACIHGGSAYAQSSPEGSFGLDLTVLPRYQGATAYRVLPLPVLALQSHTASGVTFFAEGLDGGLAWSLGPHLSVGPLIGLGLGRKQDDATLLNGTGDIDDSFLYGAFVRWQLERLTASVKFLQSAHEGYGNHVTFDVSYLALILPKDRVTVSADTIWANASAEQTYFGIDAEQSAASTAHLPVYSPSAGFSRVDLKIALDHRIDARWSLRAAAGVDTLVGDAADSPVVGRRASVFGSLGLAYRF